MLKASQREKPSSYPLVNDHIAGWKITIFNRKYIYKWWKFHCYVSLPECSNYKGARHLSKKYGAEKWYNPWWLKTNLIRIVKLWTNSKTATTRIYILFWVRFKNQWHLIYETLLLFFWLQFRKQRCFFGKTILRHPLLEVVFFPRR